MHYPAVCADVVIASVNLNHTGAELLNTIDVIAEHAVVVVADAVFHVSLYDDHFGVGTELIGAGRLQAVCLIFRNRPRCCRKRIVALCVVVIPIPQKQAAVIQHAILGVVVQAVSCVLEHSGNVLYKLAVCVKLPRAKVIAQMRNRTGSGVAVAAVVKIVLLTVNLGPCVLVVSTAEVEATSFVGDAPCTDALALVALKLIIQSVDLDSVGSCIAVFCEVVPLILCADVNPACLGNLTGHNILPAVLIAAIEAGVNHFSFANAVFAEVVVVTVGLLDAGQLNTVHIVAVADPLIGSDSAVDIFLAICPCSAVKLAASGAFQDTVLRNGIAVSGSGNGRAPVDDGLAGLAICAARVAIFGAGGYLILQCDGRCYVCCSIRIVLCGFCTVIMSAVPSCVLIITGGGVIVEPGVAFGIDLNLFPRESVSRIICEGDCAAGYFHADVNRQQFIKLPIGIIHLHRRRSAAVWLRDR